PAMNHEVISRDYATLPAALLMPFKQHGRIDTADDDDLIRSMLGRAIAHFENENELIVFASDLAVTPLSSDWFCGSVLRFEVSPVTDVVVESPAGTPLTDQSGYVLKANGVAGIRLYYLVGAYVSGMRVTFSSGFDAVAQLTPDLLDEIMRRTQHLYD